MAWPTRKNSPPATATALRASASEFAIAIEEDTVLHAKATAVLAELASDPTALTQSQDKLDALEASIRRNRRALALIEAEIDEAEKREAKAAFEAKRTDLERRTVKFARDLERRYSAAAEAFAGVLREMEANADEWERLAVEGRKVGERGGWDAEWRLRHTIPAAVRNGFASLWRSAEVRGWNGQELFDGPRDYHPGKAL